MPKSLPWRRRPTVPASRVRRLANASAAADAGSVIASRPRGPMPRMRRTSARQETPATSAMTKPATPATCAPSVLHRVNRGPRTRSLPPPRRSPRPRHRLRHPRRRQPLRALRLPCPRRAIHHLPSITTNDPLSRRSSGRPTPRAARSPGQSRRRRAAHPGFRRCRRRARRSASRSRRRCRGRGGRPSRDHGDVRAPARQPGDGRLRDRRGYPIMKFGIVTFPGSNGDYDAFQSVIEALGEEAVYLWHKDHDLQGSDVVILPGGFSYGDYLRAGAIARFSPIMREVVKHAQSGAPVVGFCNGFQIACEAGLLPGALLRNASLKFVCAPITLRVETNDSLFTSRYERGQTIVLPIAHGDGRYSADQATLDRLEGEEQVVFRYAPSKLEAEEAYNPNGSIRDIAGIVNEAGNVLGMMPHPERAVDPLLGPADGLRLFESILQRVAV